MKTFDADNIPADIDTWPEYIKARPTRMIKIDGPFRVQYAPDQVSPPCEDGYLAVDYRTPPILFPVPTRVVEQCYVEIPKEAS